jgi:DNA/RNA endonuclease YhcR with UshA esterase domain
MIKNILLALFVSLGLSASSQTIDSISAKDAAKYYDKTVKVYGTVSGGRWLQQSKITLINVDGEFPNHALVIMIKDDIRSSLKYQPETFLKGKKVVITGTVIKYRDKPEIIIASEKDISFL